MWKVGSWFLSVLLVYFFSIPANALTDNECVIEGLISKDYPKGEDYLLEKVEVLVDQGEDVNCLNEEGFKSTAVTLSIHFKFDRLLRFLLEHGGDPNMEGFALSTPLRLAITNSREDAVEILIDHGAKAQVGKKWRSKHPVYSAASGGNKKILSLILSMNPNLSLFGDDVYTRMLETYVVRHNDRGLLRKYIDLGGYISKRGFENICKEKNTSELVEEYIQYFYSRKMIDVKVSDCN